MLSDRSIIVDVSKCSTVEELENLVGLEELKKGYCSYLKNKFAHSDYNSKKTRLYKLALAAGLDKKSK